MVGGEFPIIEAYLLRSLMPRMLYRHGFQAAKWTRSVSVIASLADPTAEKEANTQTSLTRLLHDISLEHAHLPCNINA